MILRRGPLLPASALARANDGHYACAVIGQSHGTAAFGADEEFGSEFAFDAIDLVDERELLYAKPFRGDSQGAVPRGVGEPFQPVPSADLCKGRADDSWRQCGGVGGGQVGAVAGAAAASDRDIEGFGAQTEVGRSDAAFLGYVRQGAVVGDVLGVERLRLRVQPAGMNVRAFVPR